MRIASGEELADAVLRASGDRGLGERARAAAESSGVRLRARRTP